MSETVVVTNAKLAELRALVSAIIRTIPDSSSLMQRLLLCEVGDQIARACYAVGVRDGRGR